MPSGFKELTWLRGGELGEPQMPDQDSQDSAPPVLFSPSLQPFQGPCWGHLPSCGGSSKGWNACSGQVTSASWAGFLIELVHARGRLCMWEGVMGTEHGPPPSPGFMVHRLAGLPPSHCPPAGTLGAHMACLGLGQCCSLLSFQGCERVLHTHLPPAASNTRELGTMKAPVGVRCCPQAHGFCRLSCLSHAVCWSPAQELETQRSSLGPGTYP